MSLRISPGILDLNSFFIQVSTDQPDSPRRVYLHIHGTGGQVSIASDPLMVPDVAVGQSSTATNTITNTGNAVLHVTSVSSNEPYYSATTNCAAVNPGATCTVTV